MTEISATDLLDRLGTAADTLERKIADLADDDVRAATELPDWSRGHVLAHLAGVCNAMARQVEYAVRGEKVEMYDGGMAGRTQAIEMAAGLGAAEHRIAVDAALGRALHAFDGLAADQWELPISYRGGVVRDGGLALWRELVIHLSDLDVGRGPETWSKEFCLYLVDFLAARVPGGSRFKLLPLGLPAQAIGGGENTVSISGMLTDIAAWLAGRTPTLGTLRAEAAADSVPLPDLLPWPAPATAK
ncbi:maleylpyruvate isomerase family mycothiol-dependent enzyme [Specibacter cremeus]|uniref:maleylpyruvate isomerase family mycothiol-dependent enzyme n=1 Tax=Specibacter cremeus TaxID=1629051 RepID=UPI000F7B9E1C|nr:maleylpyruvate isomerase family mycothiol-dependent enzyme [Specibacter cremeus]